MISTQYRSTYLLKLPGKSYKQREPQTVLSEKGRVGGGNAGFIQYVPLNYFTCLGMDYTVFPYTLNLLLYRCNTVFSSRWGFFKYFFKKNA